MIRRILSGSLGVLVLFMSQGVSALSIDLFDCGINIDGTTDYCDFAALDANGLGTLTFLISGAGDHSFDAFFDYEIDEAVNTFFNESGSTGGTLAAGQSWEIDEPGWVFGDIYDNFVASTLDNFNNVPSGLEDDVSFALGWDFLLGSDQTAAITLFMSDVLDTSGFYLQHTDEDSSESVYFWSTLEVRGGETPVPEPGTLALFGIGLAGMGLARRRKV